ncbi:chemotaxis protein CheW [Occallatibacter riparius]|uniref:Chemotaxis protein CheW n=1 Tax=Occallatibacter riparius TaxID=1002689 RepID=A0A9J7BLA7_9BACT|nr:chemotaxis protein CheW [Occallatibacter riparius]UWZ83419.1 chemotaxis protein CheW [Occallatibacter riparius]
MPGSLRLRLQSGPHSVPLKRVYRVAGFAALSGEPDEYFAGWFRFYGKQTPVFDLNRVICETPTPEEYGSRILVVEAAPNAAVTYIGLLAPGVTDTTGADDRDVTPLDLDLYLQMLTNFIPTPPTQ